MAARDALSGSLFRLDSVAHLRACAPGADGRRPPLLSAPAPRYPPRPMKPPREPSKADRQAFAAALSELARLVRRLHPDADSADLIVRFPDHGGKVPLSVPVLSPED
jgi:hypothetical protein